MSKLFSGRDIAAKRNPASPGKVVSGVKRGWCPGALRPMESGDGLIVRVRPRSGTLTLSAMTEIVSGAERHGNGILELTRRANLQIRGVTPEALPNLHDILRRHGLLDGDPSAEQVRNIMVSPLSGLDPDEFVDIRPVATALETRLRDDARLWRLSGKFGFLLDSGARPSLSGERADIHCVAARDRADTNGFQIGLDTAEGPFWLGVIHTRDPESVAQHLCDIANAVVEVSESVAPRTPRMRDLGGDAFQTVARHASRALSPIADTASKTEGVERDDLGVLSFTSHTTVLALAAPFGSVSARAWRKVLSAAHTRGVSELRLSPWRTVYMPVPSRDDAGKLLAVAQDAGFITTASDPLLRIDACPGAPACASALGDVRADARKLASQISKMPNVRSVHMSGCAKGCARSKPADVVLVAGINGYAVVHNGIASDEPAFHIAFEDLETFTKKLVPTPAQMPHRHEIEERKERA